MSSAVLSGNTSGTGTVTLIAPNTNNTDVLMLPDGTGTLALTTSSIGYGQTWQNVVSSRSLGTTYTNTTGRPIMVSVTTYSTYNPATSITVSGVQVAYSQPNTNGGNNAYASAIAIVPAGATYVVNGSNILLWAELR